MKEVSRDAQLYGIYYANEEIKVDGGRYPLNYDFFEPEDIWETNVRGEKAWVIGIRSAINEKDIDGYIVAIEDPCGRVCVATYEKERLMELNGTRKPKQGYVRNDYIEPQHLTKSERRRERRRAQSERKRNGK